MDKSFHNTVDRARGYQKYVPGGWINYPESVQGWIEDGPAVRLDRLRAELDKMAAPR